MKTYAVLAIIGLLSLLSFASMQAADGVQPWQLHLSSALLGNTVKNLQGKDLGNLKDLVINPADNRVVYGVLASGGLLGLGEKSFAVPLGALQRASEADTLLLDMDEQRLQQAPEFNPNNWPQMTDPQWIAEIYTFYGQRPYWEQ